MSAQVYSVKFAGQAGAGIKSGGQLLSKILIKHGFNVFDYNEYPSLIRGGHNTYQVSFSTDKVYAPRFYVDAFFSILPGHWQNHINELGKDTLIFSDEEFKSQKGKSLHLPLKEIAQKVGNALSANIICIGVISFIYGFDLKVVEELIISEFGKKTETNISALKEGYAFAQLNFSKFKQKIKLPTKVQKDNCFNDGNEAYGWGFIQGGGNFYAAYPMTPATGALHFLAPRQKEYNMTVVHPEDEIAAANMVAGAAFAGARAATGTSGGGFALMNEAVSFCGVTEIGMVFYLVSRPGPATGLPTWTGQGDLLYAIFSGHGEFPKVVLAPGDHQESFELSALSLNLAAELQTPIIVVSDKMLGESSANVPDFSKTKVKINRGKLLDEVRPGFKRYLLKTKDGVSPYTLPGTKNGEFLSNSYEHDEFGFSTEDSDITIKMVEKRAAKLKLALKLTPQPILYGTKKAKKLIIGWGSTKGVILESIKMMKNPEDYAFLQFKTLWPINPDIQFIINAFKDITIVENNHTAQLATLLKSQFNFNPTSVITKFDGRPFFPEELYEKLK